jgi:hypothetical protein
VTIHIAGIPIRVGSAFWQRCASCGALLIDTQVTTPEDPPHWEPHTLVAVAVDGDTSRIAEVGPRWPPEACVTSVRKILGTVSPSTKDP